MSTTLPTPGVHRTDKNRLIGLTASFVIAGILWASIITLFLSWWA